MYAKLKETPYKALMSPCSNIWEDLEESKLFRSFCLLCTARMHLQVSKGDGKNLKVPSLKEKKNKIKSVFNLH